MTPPEARALWNILSVAQRHALVFAARNSGLKRRSDKSTKYVGGNGEQPISPIRVATVRTLGGLDLVSDGPRAMLTERGRYLVKYGASA